MLWMNERLLLWDSADGHLGEQPGTQMLAAVKNIFNFLVMNNN